MKVKEAMLAADYLPDTFKFIADGGHAWLRVPHKVIEELDMGSESFSQYSYIDEYFMYLEEDVDAGLFVSAYLARYGHEPTYTHIFEERTNIRYKMRNWRET
jgi:hypothetical protein